MLRYTNAADRVWHEAPLTQAELSRETGVLSLTLETPVTLLVDSKTERVELGVGRKGAGMWAAHDEVCWHDCVPDDALDEGYSIICTSVTGNTWLGSRTGDRAGTVAYHLQGVQLLLLRNRLGSGEAQAPSDLLYKSWSKYGDISTIWVQTWVMTLPHTAATPLRLARSPSAQRTRSGGGREGGGSDELSEQQEEEEDTEGGGILGSDIKALRFCASCLARLVTPR